MLFYRGSLLWLAVLAMGKKSDKADRLTTTAPTPGDPLGEVVCEESDDGYIVPDPDQCDRYAECTPRGKLIIRLCPDGYALDLQNGVCDLAYKVNCEARSKQQAPTGDGLCPRLNGNFPLAAELSCSDYVDCREGQPFQMSCGHGAVFDPVLGCVHPDQTNRPGCTATDVLGFRCPAAGTDTTFGDHQRLPHPTDCALFYACLSTGLPRLLGCTKPKVFNPVTGLCDNQKNVAGCENAYPEEAQELDIQAERSKLEAEIRAELEEKFGLRPSSRQRQEPATTTTTTTAPPPPPPQRTEVRTAASSRAPPSPSRGGAERSDNNAEAIRRSQQAVGGGQRGQPALAANRAPASEAREAPARTRITSYDSAPAFLGPQAAEPTASEAPAPVERNLRLTRPLLFSKPKAGL